MRQIPKGAYAGCNSEEGEVNKIIDYYDHIHALRKLHIAECEKCKLWDIMAKQSGHSYGMCEECFNEHFVMFETGLDK